MDKITPRVWYARQYEQGMVMDENTGETIAVTYDPKNAAIMAAAPDLRNALIMAAAFIENGESSGYTFFEVREAWRNAFEKAETS